MGIENGNSTGSSVDVSTQNLSSAGRSPEPPPTARKIYSSTHGFEAGCRHTLYTHYKEYQPNHWGRVPLYVFLPRVTHEFCPAGYRNHRP